MKKLCLILLIVFAFGEKMDCDGPSGSMDMSGNQVQSIDPATFGKGLNAKICPVSGKAIKLGQEVEASLSNGKKIMMCCPDCKKTIEADLKKYERLMYQAE